MRTLASLSHHETGRGWGRHSAVEAQFCLEAAAHLGVEIIDDGGHKRRPAQSAEAAPALFRCDGLQVGYGLKKLRINGDQDAFALHQKGVDP